VFALCVYQITRGSDTLRARLAQLLTEGSSPNPRWLIKFDGQPHKDEEVYEHTFGRLLEAAEDVSDSGTNNEAPQQATAAPRRTNNNNNNDNNKPVRKPSSKGSGGSSADENADVKKKSVTFSNQSSPLGSDESDTKNMSVTAREERSRRRQSLIEEVPNHKRKPPPNNNNNKKAKRTKLQNEPVTKVKFLTGTLYIYRNGGRAEFVRTK